MQCRVREHWMGNIVILRIQSIPVQRDRIQKIILDKYAEVLEETDDAETAEI